MAAAGCQEGSDEFDIVGNFVNILKCSHSIRVARWYIFEQKIQIFVNFGGSCNGRYSYIFDAHWDYFVAVWYILWHFGIFLATWYIF
jgi:hypothetical protein